MIGLVKLNDRIADFGAEQVILVRDDAAKERLQKQIGEIALVLTILEGKGMEFDDVLVYDFFSGSDLGSSYRCLHLLARGAKNQFDSQRHTVCSLLLELEGLVINSWTGSMLRIETPLRCNHQSPESAVVCRKQ